MKTLILGAVAYDPKVVTIWEGFKQHFADRGLPFDFVLYSNYERLVEDQLDGVVDVAWNSPLAWIEAERAARARRRQDADPGKSGGQDRCRRCLGLAAGDSDPSAPHRRCWSVARPGF